MALFTIKLSFLMSDELMRRLDSLALEVGETRDKVVSDILQMHIGELSGLAVSILNKGLAEWEKMKQTKGKQGGE